MTRILCGTRVSECEPNAQAEGKPRFWRTSDFKTAESDGADRKRRGNAPCEGKPRFWRTSDFKTAGGNCDTRLDKFDTIYLAAIVDEILQKQKYKLTSIKKNLFGM